MLPGDSLAPLFAGDRVDGKWNMVLRRAGGVGAALGLRAAAFWQRRRSTTVSCGARWMGPVVDGAGLLRTRVEAWRAKTRLASILQTASHLSLIGQTRGAK